jgi:hypothetical protein
VELTVSVSVYVSTEELEPCTLHLHLASAQLLALLVSAAWRLKQRRRALLVSAAGERSVE